VCGEIYSILLEYLRTKLNWCRIHVHVSIGKGARFVWDIGWDRSVYRISSMLIP